MLRYSLLFALAVVACKKTKKPEEDAGPPPAPKVGHSITKIKGGSAAEGEGEAQATGDGGETVEVPADAHVAGGDGSPAYRAKDGRVHGPGGPVFMGAGMTCDAEHDHCLRDGVWFSVDNIVSGKLYRALPVFQFEDRWYNWRGDDATVAHAYKTKLADPQSPPGAGKSIIWFSAETSTNKWTDSEYDAMTSSRWEAGIVESSNSGVVRVKGWPDVIPIDTVRVLTEQKNN